MKQIHSRLTAFVLSAITAISALSAFPVMAETNSSGEKTQITVHFDISDPDITFDVDEDGNPIEITDITADANSSVKIPEIYVHKKDYSFSGWTVDGVRGYPVNSVIQVGDEDVTLTPVWYTLSDKTEYNIEYKVEIEGEEVEIPKTLQNLSARQGRFVEVSLQSFYYPDSSRSQIGWNYDGKTYLGQQYIIMPDHDIVLTPNWLRFYKLRYTPGDVDRLNGATSGEFDRLETISYELAESSRFSRNGFKITGWICDEDNKIYAPLQAYTMPSHDVTFTAVWEPLTYKVVFIGGTGKSEDIIRIEGKTDTKIICPELTGTKSGYYFDGWKFEEEIDGVTTTTIYQPGDEFLIKGAKPGLGISLNAVWKEGTRPTEETVKYGDADCNGELFLNDAVLIMQAIGNPDAYGVGGSEPSAITAKGAKNGDCCNTGDGLTNLDALSVQKYLIGILTELPCKTE